MKMKHLLTITVFLFVQEQSLADVIDFNDIVTWSGSGANEAALVIDWNDGQSPLAWGYRWDGTATGEDLFRVVAATDNSLFARIQVFGFGALVNGIGYDRDNDGFGVSGISGAKSFGAGGIFEGAETDFGTKTDSDDSYSEANNSTFEYWEYFNGAGNPYDGGSWASATSGFSGRSLANGDWDGWYYPGTFGGDPSAIPGNALAAGAAAVPEPSSVLLMAFGSIGLLLCRRSQSRKQLNTQSLTS
jgi:hypothetical protein